MAIRKSTAMRKPSDLKPKSPTPSPSALEVATWAKEIIWAADALDARSVQTTIGPSEVGTECKRRLAYKMSGAPVSNPGGDSLSAMAGTGTHDKLAKSITANDAVDLSNFAWEGVEDWLAERIRKIYGATNRYLVETRVTYKGISGSCDVFDKLTHRVIDWKTLGTNKARRMRPKPTWDPKWIVQANIYGAGMEARGERVEEVCIVLVPLEGTTDDIQALVRPYERKVADDAIAELEKLRADLRDSEPGDIPALPSGLCPWCPFYRPGSTDLKDGCPGRLGVPGVDN